MVYWLLPLAEVDSPSKVVVDYQTLVVEDLQRHALGADLSWAVEAGVDLMTPVGVVYEQVLEASVATSDEYVVEHFEGGNEAVVE